MNPTKEGVGKHRWAFAAGHLPLRTTGSEPMFTSHDKIAVLNTSDDEVQIIITLSYADQKPVAYHPLIVPARRVRKIRFNDLINPLPLPLATPFSFLIESNQRVVIQFSRMNTSSRVLTGFCVTPYSK